MTIAHLEVSWRLGSFGLERVDPAYAPAGYGVADLAGAVDAGKVVGSLDVHLVKPEAVAQFEAHFIGEEVADGGPQLCRPRLDVVDLKAECPRVAVQSPFGAEMETPVGHGRPARAVEGDRPGELGHRGIGAAGSSSRNTCDLS